MSADADLRRVVAGDIAVARRFAGGEVVRQTELAYHVFMTQHQRPPTTQELVDSGLYLYTVDGTTGPWPILSRAEAEEMPRGAIGVNFQDRGIRGLVRGELAGDGGTMGLDIEHPNATVPLVTAGSAQIATNFLLGLMTSYAQAHGELPPSYEELVRSFPVVPTGGLLLSTPSSPASLPLGSGAGRIEISRADNTVRVTQEISPGRQTSLVFKYTFDNSRGWASWQPVQDPAELSRVDTTQWEPFVSLSVIA